LQTRGFFTSQVDHLKKSLVRMGETAGRLMGDSVAALCARDALLAREVIARDEELDRLEDEHEELITQAMALNQPVARDLRTLIALLRVNATIERVGDVSINIAQTAVRLSELPPIRPFVDIPRQYELVRPMWDDAVRSLSDMDEALASAMRDRDDLVDDMNARMIVQLIEIARDSPEFIFQSTNLIGVSKSLERIADLAVDISHEVIFVARGELRHARNHRKSA